MFHVSFDLNIMKWLSSSIFERLDATDRIEMNDDLRHVILDSYRLFDSDTDEWFVYVVVV